MNIRSLLKFLPDNLYCQLYYFAKMKKFGNFKNPKTFNEKINWRKLYDRNPIYAKLSDKYAVREYITEKIGEEYLVPLLGVWNDANEIDFDKLPDKFVLKCTHDCASVVICNDKQNFDIEKAKKKLNNCLKTNFYWQAREWQYKNIKPRIIAEQYLVDESGVDLKDYKIFCFGGKPEFILVDFNRFSTHKRNLYTINWDFCDFEIKYPCDKNIKIEKPSQLENMLKLAEILSKDNSYVRVDFYIADGKIYFGELTFSNGGGYSRFTPTQYDRKIGDLWKI